MIYCTIGIGTGLAPLMARHLTGDDRILMHWVILLCYIARLIGYLTHRLGLHLTHFADWDLY